MRIAVIGLVGAVLLSAGNALAQTPPPPEAMAAPSIAAPAEVAEWRTIPADDLMVIDTNKGRVFVELVPEIAPLHVERMKLLTRAGFFDGLKFHRVIDQFMAQTGDPLGTGEGQSPYPDLKAEFTFRRGPDLGFTPVASPAGSVVGFVRSVPIQSQPDALMPTTTDGKVHGWGLYCPGVAGMARDDGNDTANSQFFLMRQPYPSLEKRYTVWGAVVSGLDIVRSLKVGEGAGGIVVEPDRMTRVRLAADLPEAERPVVEVMDTRSAAFHTLSEQVRTRRGADFSACDIALPVKVSGPAQVSAAPVA